MKKRFAAALMSFVVAGSMLLGACGSKQAPAADSSAKSGSAAEAVSAASTAATSTAAQEDDGNYTKGKIAVFRNMTSSDHTSLFFQGITDEGHALGYQVDTFMSDGDDVKMQDLMEQGLQQDYDIWIVSHANEGYQADFVQRAIDKGIKVVGFDCAGDEVDGCTYTTQDDASLTQISIDAMLEKAEENGAKEPVKFIEVNTLGAIAPFDRRHAAIQKYVDDGKIQIVQMISPNLSGGDAYSDINTGVSTTLSNNPDGVDAIWVASTGFLDGVVDAVDAAGLTDKDIVLGGVDISNTELERMTKTPAYWVCAAVNPYLIGVMDTRIAYNKVLGNETPAEFKFSAVGVKNSDVKDGETMDDLGAKVEGFSQSEDFLTDDIKAAEEKAGMHTF